jgi:hypothetical protein
MSEEAKYTLFIDEVKKGDYTASEIMEFTGATKGTVIQAACRGLVIKGHYTVARIYGEKGRWHGSWIGAWAREWDALTEPYRKGKQQEVYKPETGS